MLTVKEVHLLIEQGLNSLGIFTEMSNLHEQVDLSINHVVEKDILRIKDIPRKRRNSLEESIIRYLTSNINLPLRKEGDYFIAEIPIDFGESSSSNTLLALCNCEGDCFNADTCEECSSDNKDSVIIGDYYIAKGDVKYNGIWYKNGQFIKILDSITEYYGTIDHLSTIKKSNIEVSIDSLESYSLTSIYKNSLRPLFGYNENNFYIYYKTISKKKEVPLELFVNYVKDYSKTPQVSWCNNQTLDFPSSIQRYYIDLTIAYLAIVNKQEQQNIVNLKSETV